MTPFQSAAQHSRGFTVAEPPQDTQQHRSGFLVGRLTGKAAICCLSFANICFQNAWADLLNRDFDFYRKYAVTWQQLAAVSLDILLFAAVLWIPVSLMATSRSSTTRRILKWAALAGLTIPFNTIRYSNQAAAIRSLPIFEGELVRFLVTAVCICAALVLLWSWERIAIRAVSTMLLIFAPVLPVVVLSVAWTIHQGPPAGRFPDKPSTSVPSKAGAPHVLWFVFDEWEESLTFPGRPADLELPELDRFLGQSFHADRAYPPNGDETMISIPSLLTGKTYVGEKPGGPNELMLAYGRNRQDEPFTRQSTVFSEARSSEFNVGLVGFYIPYCRLIDTTTCKWFSPTALNAVEWEYPVSVGLFMELAAKRQVPMVPFARRLGLVQPFSKSERMIAPLLSETYRQIREETLRSIVDSRLNLVFIHLNIPHPPAIYDAKVGRLSTRLGSTYTDNLKLVDLTLRDVRLKLEQAGMWDDSTILLTSDHPFRLELWKKQDPAFEPHLAKYKQSSEVPFLLKLAGQKQSYRYGTAMQTVVTKDLLLAILKGEITQPEQVAYWLDRNPPRM